MDPPQFLRPYLLESANRKFFLLIFIHYIKTNVYVEPTLQAMSLSVQLT
jgi:hypothetical protein